MVRLEKRSKNDLSRPINGYEITRNCPCLPPSPLSQRYIAVVTRSKLLPSLPLLTKHFYLRTVPERPRRRYLLCIGDRFNSDLPFNGNIFSLLIIVHSLYLHLPLGSRTILFSLMVHEKRKSLPCVGSQISFAKMRGKCGKGVVKVSNILASVVRFLLNKCFVLDSTRVCTLIRF